MALVVALGGGAYAAVGDGVILGEVNKSKQLTTIRNTDGGSALELATKNASKAPLRVSNDTKIKKLNADKLDGHSSGYFAKAQDAVVASAATSSSIFSITSTTFVAVPEMTTSFNVPTGGSRTLFATYSAECNAEGDDGQYAVVQILLDGTPITPSPGDYTMCSPHFSGDDTGGGWVGAAIQAVSNAGPGNHTVRVQVRNASTSSVRLDNHTLTVLAIA